MILDKIVEFKIKELAKRKKDVLLSSFIDKIILKETDFYNNLAKDGMSLIAEVKKASPSKGIIREDFDPVKIAKEYENSCVDAISVLTDYEFFKGKLEYLDLIAKEVKTPLLRKEFIIDEYQIYEAKYYGASAILLIGEILDYNTLMKFIELAYSLKLDVLLEVHSMEILKKALDTPARIIGVNNRNLKTFEVDLNNVINLREHIPSGRLTVAESGIKTREDVVKLEKNGIDAMLIGESIMKSNDIGESIKLLLGR